MDISVAVGMEGAKKILEEVEFVMSINRQIVQTSEAVVPTPENNILGKHALQGNLPTRYLQVSHYTFF